MRQNLNGVIGEITSLPGCSQVGVSHDVFALERGKGHGKAANAMRQREAFEYLGYDMLLCTVDSDNTAQISILRANGWEFLSLFTSRKTGHRVELWACYDSKTQ